MKKKLFLFFLSLSTLTAISCGEDETADEPEVLLNAPVLTATPEEVVITGSESSAVLTLDWTSASDEQAMTYTLIYGLSGETKTLAMKCGSDLTKRFTRQEIDDIRTALGVSAETFRLDFRVEANCSAVAGAVSSESVSVGIAYDIPEVVIPLELYPIGDSFAWGWKRDQAEKMATEDHVSFTWTGEMQAGAFKFLTHESIANESWLPSYNRDEGAEEYWTLLLRSEESAPDTQFKVEEKGNYTITLNVETLTIGLVRNDEPEVATEEQLYVYGLSGSDRLPMTSEDKTLWSWTGDVKVGKFKFFCVSEGWFPSYNYDRTENGVIYAYKREQGNTRDDLFEITEAGNYTFTIDVNTLVVTITRNDDPNEPEVTTEEQLYIYGLSGTDRLPMTSGDKTLWSWTGDVKVGKFKFFCVSEGWFPSYNYDRTENGVIYAYKREQGNTRDDLFEITEAGNYTFTIDVNTLVVTITRNDDPNEPEVTTEEQLYIYGLSGTDRLPMTSGDKTL